MYRLKKFYIAFYFINFSLRAEITNILQLFHYFWLPYQLIPRLVNYYIGKS